MNFIFTTILVEVSKARNFIKIRLQHRCFPVNFAKFLRTPILKNICERLLLENDFNRFGTNLFHWGMNPPNEIFDLIIGITVH